MLVWAVKGYPFLYKNLSPWLLSHSFFSLFIFIFHHLYSRSPSKTPSLFSQPLPFQSSTHNTLPPTLFYKHKQNPSCPFFFSPFSYIQTTNCVPTSTSSLAFTLILSLATKEARNQRYAVLKALDADGLLGSGHHPDDSLGFSPQRSHAGGPCSWAYALLLYRWRHHLRPQVQGLWIDVIHFFVLPPTLTLSLSLLFTSISSFALQLSPLYQALVPPFLHQRQTFWKSTTTTPKSKKKTLLYTITLYFNLKKKWGKKKKNDAQCASIFYFSSSNKQ